MKKKHLKKNLKEKNLKMHSLMMMIEDYLHVNLNFDFDLMNFELYKFLDS